MIKKAW